MTKIKYSELTHTDLYIDTVYEGGSGNTFKDEPLSRLLGVDNQGGFRVLGKKKGVIDLKLLVLTTTFSDPDWPDDIDMESGLFTYFGDNKKGGELHETGRNGNAILREIFLSLHDLDLPRKKVPPILVFSSTGEGRNTKFLGLAVPGAAGLTANEDLVAVWKIAKGSRFQNYKAVFTILNAPVISRKWLEDIKAGNILSENAPAVWINWKRKGSYFPLIADKTVEFRTMEEQLPKSATDQKMLETIHAYFKSSPVKFEQCAAEITRMLLPRTIGYTLTRPSRDGGRDAIGFYSIGHGHSSVKVEFAMEAKCKGMKSGVGVKETSRLISRLRHRQFGVFVTTSFINKQAYEEIKEDAHPIIIISGRDIIEILKTKQITTVEDVRRWLQDNFKNE